MKTSISFLKSKKSIEDTIKELENTNTDYIHVDIMDGKFVDNTTLSVDETLSLFKDVNKPLDIHLMVESPKAYIDAFKDLKVEYITIHSELYEDIEELIDLIHSYGIKAGIAVNPDTSIEFIDKYLDKVEQVLIMGVYPGAGGQKLISDTLTKIDELAVLRADNTYRYVISLDGGVNQNTKSLLYGLDIIVSGSYVCMNDNYQEIINSLRTI